MTKSEWEGLSTSPVSRSKSLYGGFDREPFDDESLELVWVARKAAELVRRDRAALRPVEPGVVEDISLLRRGGARRGRPVVELGVGTGRIAIPTAPPGVHVIGVDSSAGMLEVCAQPSRGTRASPTGSTCGSATCGRPPVDERVALVTCPFRAYLHLASDEERLEALARRARRCSAPAAG